MYSAQCKADDFSGYIVRYALWIETRHPNPEFTEDVIIQKILDMFRAAGMDTYQSQELLEKTQAILEIGKRAVKGTKDH